MGYSARRRLYVSVVAIFVLVMLAVLALIARNGMSGATDRIVFGIQLLLWSVVLTGFPFALNFILGGAQKQPRRTELVPKTRRRDSD